MTVFLENRAVFFEKFFRQIELADVPIEKSEHRIDSVDYIIPSRFKPLSTAWYTADANAS